MGLKDYINLLKYKSSHSGIAFYLTMSFIVALLQLFLSWWVTYWTSKHNVEDQTFDFPVIFICGVFGFILAQYVRNMSQLY